MKCGECGYRDKRDDWDLEPAISAEDRTHPNYEEEYDCVAICPECERASMAAENAAYRRYMSGVEYAVGIRD